MVNAKEIKRYALNTNIMLPLLLGAAVILVALFQGLEAGQQMVEVSLLSLGAAWVIERLLHLEKWLVDRAN